MEEITISMEEYKELLIIKGKYEELKSQSLYKINQPLIREIGNKDYDWKLTTTPIPETPYKIICANGEIPEKN